MFGRILAKGRQTATARCGSFQFGRSKWQVYPFGRYCQSNGAALFQVGYGVLRGSIATLGSWFDSFSFQAKAIIRMCDENLRQANEPIAG